MSSFLPCLDGLAAGNDTPLRGGFVEKPDPFSSSPGAPWAPMTVMNYCAGYSPATTSGLIARRMDPTPGGARPIHCPTTGTRPSAKGAVRPCSTT